MDGDTELGFAEFVLFVVVIKKIETKCNLDPEFAIKAFPPDQVKRKQKRPPNMTKSEAWNLAMKQLDEEAVAEAWDVLINFIESRDGGEGGGDEKENTRNRIHKIFKMIDTDQNSIIDIDEISAVLLVAGT